MRLAGLALAFILFVRPGAAQDDGIPVTDPLVRNACGSCHEVDERGRMTRISFQRKAPEGWELTLKRMIRTAGLDLTAEQARAIVRYLSDHHGLAPAEERPYFYRAEKRPQLETIEDEEIKETCVRCHLGARFFTQRRTKEEWELLKGMHVGYFPDIEGQTFRGPSSPEVDSPGREPDPTWRVDRVIEKLAAQLPLETPEWRAFRAKGAPRGLEGRWLLVTREPGKGPATGIVTVAKNGGDYAYRGETRLADGTRHMRSGKGALYGGYSWRGSSEGDGLGDLREVLMLSDDGTTLEGRFFSGTFGELGLDVRLERIGRDPRIVAVHPRSARVGTSSFEVQLLGANLENVSAGSLDFGAGVRLRRIVSASPERVTVEIEVAADALAGSRDVSFDTASAVDAFAVYDRVDYVKVVPEESLARVGGEKVPKQYARFEALAYHRGPDDEPLTDDDVNLGLVEPEWSLEEYHIRQDDDDLDYVGTIDPSGLFTPNREGPNFDRELNADNFGDVWVVASYTPPGASQPLKGRSRLVVTIPVYVFWELFP